MSDWDVDSPEDNDIVSQYPANERAAREAARTNFGVDHRETNDDDVGKHEAVQFLDQETDPEFDTGDVGVWNNGGEMRTRTADGNVRALLSAEVGTAMVFYQASAPTGWTQDEDVNDRVLRVVDGEGGGTGGSWTISGVTVNNHALTISEMPNHSHTGSTTTDGAHSHSGSTTTTGNHSHSGSTTTDGGHTHEVPYSGAGGDSTGADLSNSSGFPGFNTSGAGNHNHSLNINSNGNHSHSLNINNNGNHNHSLSINGRGGGNGHNHGLMADGNWRPSHIDVIVATKD